METVSVQPTTSEPNEQSNELILDYRAIAKHQQKRIDELEEMLQMNANESMREPELIQSLQAQLNVAVSAMQTYSIDAIEDALNTINKLKAGE